MSDFLQYALDYSLKSSSRSPIDFSSHQKILWMLDAWTSIGDGNNLCFYFVFLKLILDYLLTCDWVFLLVHTKIANFVHEMWFSWHSSLWYCCSELDKVPYKIVLRGQQAAVCLISLVKKFFPFVTKCRKLCHKFVSRLACLRSQSDLMQLTKCCKIISSTALCFHFLPCCFYHLFCSRLATPS